MDITPPEPRKPYPHPYDRGGDAPHFGTNSDQRQAVLNTIRNFRAQPTWIEQLDDRVAIATIDWIEDEIEPPIDKNTHYIGEEWDTAWMRAADVFNLLMGCKEYILKLRGEGVLIEPAADTTALWMKAEVLDNKLRQEFIDAVSLLEQTPYAKRGWDPIGPTRPRVTDLLDPYMYPIMYRKTLYSRSPDEEFEPVLPPPALTSYSNYLCDSICWLPTEFEVAQDGKSTKIHSYINNLSLPGQDELLHPFFEKIFTDFVPSFNHVLADLDRKPWKKDWRPPESYNEINKKLAAKHLWTPPEISSSNRLEGKTVNIVTRLVNIELTPEEPVYEDRELNWHIDGMANERIIATGIYQYAQENITTPSLQLRQRPYLPIYIGQMSTSILKIHPISLEQNSAVTFTNIYENRISSFQLIDKTKPGSLKLLIFHLFDPFAPDPVPSTRHIPPQQPNQYQHEKLLRKTPLGQFPEEIFRDILDYTKGNTITVQSAVESKKFLAGNRFWIMHNIYVPS